MLAFLLLWLTVLFVNMWIPQILSVATYINMEQQYVMSMAKVTGNKETVDIGDEIKLARGEISKEYLISKYDYRLERNKLIAIEQAMITTCRTLEREIKNKGCTVTYANVWSFASSNPVVGSTGTINNIINGTSTNRCSSADLTCANIADFGRCLFKNTGITTSAFGNLTPTFVLRDSIIANTYCGTPDIISYN